MLSAAITIALVGVMLLIVVSLIVGARNERERFKKTLSTQITQTDLPPHPLDPHVKMILHMHDGVIVRVEQPKPSKASHSFSLSASWYTRWRVLISLSLLLIVFLALFVQSGLADGELLRQLGKGFNFLSLSSQPAQNSDIKTVAHPLIYTASQSIVRIDSAARNQYYTDYQWQVWGYSSCSGIAMEEVLNSYGMHVIAADVLQTELNMGVWSVYGGLLGGEISMARVANYYGFRVSPTPPRTLNDLITVANKGYPVIVGNPSHIFVVRGGDSNNVYVVDSAPADLTVLTHQQFMNIWNGFSVLVLP
jgi:hypothetical protein